MQLHVSLAMSNQAASKLLILCTGNSNLRGETALKSPPAALTINKNMNLKELKICLQARPELNLAITLPDGRPIPAHFHVTEVGHIAKKIVDCGGTFRATETCVLQTYTGSAQDDGHRLTAGKLAHILGLAGSIFPSDELPVEVEYEDGVVSQFPLTGAGLVGDTLTLQLGLKHTDCRAKAKCGIDDGCGCDAEAGPVESAGCCGAPAGSTACC